MFPMFNFCLLKNFVNILKLEIISHLLCFSVVLRIPWEPPVDLMVSDNKPHNPICQKKISILHMNHLEKIHLLPYFSVLS